MRKLFLAFTVALLLLAGAIVTVLWFDYRSRTKSGFGLLSCFANNRGAVADADRVLEDKVLQHLGLSSGTYPAVVRGSYQSDEIYWFVSEGDHERWSTLLDAMRFAAQSGSRIWKVRQLNDADPNGASTPPEWWPQRIKASYDTWEFESASDHRGKHVPLVMFRVGFEHSSGRIYLCNIRG